MLPEDSLADARVANVCIHLAIDSHMDPETSCSVTVETGGGIEIRFDRDVLGRLNSACGAGAASLPEAEIFGLLLGRKAGGGTSIVTEISDFQPAWCEKGMWTRELPVLLSAYGERPECQPVGFFRTHQAVAASLAPDELEMVARYFDGAGSVFLLVSRPSSEAGSGILYVRSAAKQLLGMERPAPFPFQERFLSAFASVEPTRRQPDMAWLRNACSAKPEAPVPRQKTSLVKAVVVTAFLILGLAAVLYLRGWLPRLVSSPPAVPASEAGMTVERDGAVVRVRWNCAAGVLRGARSATLTIADGSRIKTIALDPGVQRGEVVYTPSTNDVEFRIRTTGDTGNSEIVRVLGAPMAEKTLLPAKIPASPRLTRKPLAARVVNTREFQPPRRPPPLQPTLPPPPATGPVGAAPLIPVAIGSSLPHAEAPAPRTPVSLPAESREPASPAGQSPVQVSYVPALLMKQVNPVLPLLARSQIRVDTVITVLVGIDESGRVSSAAVERSEPAVSKLITDAVLDAAHLFRFEPARSQGQKIPSRMLLTFRIRRPA